MGRAAVVGVQGSVEGSKRNPEGDPVLSASVEKWWWGPSLTDCRRFDSTFLIKNIENIKTSEQSILESSRFSL